MALGVGHIKLRRRYLPESVKLRMDCKFIGSSADVVEVAKGSVLISTHHIDHDTYPTVSIRSTLSCKGFRSLDLLLL